MIELVALPTEGIGLVQCGICFTVIHASRTDDHDTWHQTLVTGHPGSKADPDYLNAAERLAQAAWLYHRGTHPDSARWHVAKADLDRALEAWAEHA